MLTKSYCVLMLIAIDSFVIFLIKILIFSLPDDTLKEVYETGPGDMVHLLALIQEDRMGKTVRMQDLFREDFSIVVEVIDSESAEVT